MKDNPNEEIVIDLAQVARTLWRHAALILLVGILLAALFFFYAYTFVTPQYQASVLFYVNNSSFSVGSTSVRISSGELNAASDLVDTYVAILQSRSHMELVMQESGLDYSYEKLKSMVSAKAVNSTGLFSVTVTATNPEIARQLANVIAGVLPTKISEIVDNSSVKVVDYAVTPRTRTSPNFTRYALYGLLAGMVLTSAVVLLISLMDTVIRDEDYLHQTYDAPVLAAIPDLLSNPSRKYGYYGYGSQSKSAKKGGKA